MQPAGIDPPLDRPRADVERQQLHAADDAVLPCREGRDRGVGSASGTYCADSAENARLEGDHPAIVVPAALRDVDERQSEVTTLPASFTRACGAPPRMLPWKTPVAWPPLA